MRYVHLFQLESLEKDIQHRFTRTLQLKVATKNPFQFKIMTNPVITFSTIFRSTPVKNRQLTGRLMIKDKEKPILTYLKLGKWRLTDVEPTHRLGLMVMSPRLHS